MRESLGITNPKGTMKVKAGLACRPRCDPAPLRVGATPARLVRPVLRSGRRSKSVPVGTRKMVNYA